MATKARANKGKSDFSRLFYEVRAGQKPIDALLDEEMFRKRLRAMLAKFKAGAEEAQLVNELTARVFSSLQRLKSDDIHELELEFDDLLASMQSAKSKRAVQKAFKASPAQLGRAAIRQATKKS